MLREATFLPNLPVKSSSPPKKAAADPDTNFRLRLAVQKARDSNMPMENIDRAIEKGTGNAEGGSIDRNDAGRLRAHRHGDHGKRPIR